MKRIAVYCGSSLGNKAIYKSSTIDMANAIHQHQCGVVYGGGNIGLMGVLADEMIRLKGEIIGVIPSILYEREVAHRSLTELHIVNSMHERKAKMFELSDAIIALPGGIGTMEEFFEAYTWQQIGIHHIPCGILNIDGFYDPLIALLDHMADSAFLRAGHRELIHIHHDPHELLNLLVHAVGNP